MADNERRTGRDRDRAQAWRGFTVDQTGGRAAKLIDRARKLEREHQGNRISADDGEPQPTREVTRDRRR
jgi:hypothetical protein